jgi:NAD(P)-dependent dehydrogenase (short-subunit alcohol dehydrogenase family)
MQELADKVVVVTGAARGLGECLLRTLAARGASVIAADVREEMLGRACAAVRENGGEAEPRKVDVTDPAAVDGLIDGVLSERGRIDVLINNAAVDVCTPVEQLEVVDFDRVIAVNLRASFLTIRRVLPHMRERRSGNIVNVISTAGVRVWPCASAYHASKWGLLGFTHAMDKEARPHNVRVTAVVAGGMRTPFITERFPDVPLDTLADPQDVADCVMFALARPDGVFMPTLTVMPLGDPSFP